MANDRDIIRKMPNENPIDSLSQDTANGNDKLKNSLQTFIDILKEMNKCLDDSAKKMQDFKDSMGTTEEKKKPSIFKSIFKKNLDALKDTVNFKKDPEKPFDTISKAFGDLSTIFGNDKATANVMKWSKGLSDVAGNITKGKPLDALASAGKVLSSIITTGNAARKEIRKFERELERLTIDYTIKSIAATKNTKSDRDSIFGNDKINKLAQGMKGHNDAQAMLNQLNDRLGSEKIQTKKKKRRFLKVPTGVKIKWGDFRSNYKRILGTDKDLIDATGKLDMAMAETLIGSGKLSEEASKTLNQMVNVQKAADEAMAQVNETLSSMSGTIGTDLQKALVSSFRDGTDAAEDFGKSVSTILEKIITEQMFNIVFGEKLNELEKRMKSSYSVGGDMDITDDIAWFYKTYSQNVDEFNKGLANAKEQVKGMTGLNILEKTKNNTAQPSSGGFESMSQDQAGELNGRFTAMHETGLRIESGLNSMLEIQTRNNDIFTEQSNQLLQLCSINVQSMYHLEDITKNTKQLYQINDRLGAIERHTARL